MYVKRLKDDEILQIMRVISDPDCEIVSIFRKVTDPEVVINSQDMEVNTRCLLSGGSASEVLSSNYKISRFNLFGKIRIQ